MLREYQPTLLRDALLVGSLVSPRGLSYSLLISDRSTSLSMTSLDIPRTAFVGEIIARAELYSFITVRSCLASGKTTVMHLLAMVRNF